MMFDRRRTRMLMRMAMRSGAAVQMEMGVITVFRGDVKV